MRTCLNIALFPIGLIVTLILVAANSIIGDVLALVWGLVVLPFGARFMISRSREGREFLRQMDTVYWRTGSR
jgi:hypothetical protein